MIVTLAIATPATARAGESGCIEDRAAGTVTCPVAFIEVLHTDAVDGRRKAADCGADLRACRALRELQAGAQAAPVLDPWLAFGLGVLLGGAAVGVGVAVF